MKIYLNHKLISSCEFSTIIFQKVLTFTGTEGEKYRQWRDYTDTVNIIITAIYKDTFLSEKKIYKYIELRSLKLTER